MLIENEGDHDDQSARACSAQTNAFSMHAVAARHAIHLSPRFEGNAKQSLKMTVEFLRRNVGMDIIGILMVTMQCWLTEEVAFQKYFKNIFGKTDQNYRNVNVVHLISWLCRDYLNIQ